MKPLFLVCSVFKSYLKEYSSDIVLHMKWARRSGDRAAVDVSWQKGEGRDVWKSTPLLFWRTGSPSVFPSVSPSSQGGCWVIGELVGKRKNNDSTPSTCTMPALQSLKTKFFTELAWVTARLPWLPVKWSQIPGRQCTKHNSHLKGDKRSFILKPRMSGHGLGT